MTRRYEIYKLNSVMLTFNIKSILTKFDNKFKWTLWSHIGECVEPFSTYSAAAQFIEENEELFQADKDSVFISFMISRQKML